MSYGSFKLPQSSTRVRKSENENKETKPFSIFEKENTTIKYNFSFIFCIFCVYSRAWKGLLCCFSSYITLLTFSQRKKKHKNKQKNMGQDMCLSPLVCLVCMLHSTIKSLFDKHLMCCSSRKEKELPQTRTQPSITQPLRVDEDMLTESQATPMEHLCEQPPPPCMSLRREVSSCFASINNYFMVNRAKLNWTTF